MLQQYMVESQRTYVHDSSITHHGQSLHSSLCKLDEQLYELVLVFLLSTPCADTLETKQYGGFEPKNRDNKRSEPEEIIEKIIAPHETDYVLVS